MALSIVSSAVVLNTTDGVFEYTATSTFPVVGGAGKVLLVFVQMCQGSISPGWTVTANGAAMTQLSFIAHSALGSRPAAGVFAIAAETAGNYTIVATSEQQYRSATFFCVELAGADINALTGAVVATEGNPPAMTLTPTAADSLLFGMLTTRRGTLIPFTPHAGMTEMLDVATGDTATSDHSAWIGYRASGGTTSTDLGSDASQADDQVFTGIEILAASGGGRVESVTGSGAALEAGTDAAAGAGEVLITGTGAAAESGADTATGSGYVGVAPVVTSIGLGSVQEAGNDTAAGSGSVAVNGAGSALEAGSDAAAGRGRGTAEIPETPLARVVAVSPQSRTVNAAAQVRLVTVPAANFVTRAT